MANAPVRQRDRGSLQKLYSERLRTTAHRAVIPAVAGGATTFLGLVGLAASGENGACIAMIVAGIVMTGVSCIVRFTTLKQASKDVFVPEDAPIGSAMIAITDLLSMVKRADRTQDETDRAVNRATQLLRRVIDAPLTAVSSPGYYPNGTTDEEDGLKEHWERLESQLTRLNAIASGEAIVSRETCQKEARAIISPLRTILRRYKVVALGIEYGGYDRSALEAPTKAERPVGIAAARRKGLPAPCEDKDVTMIVSSDQVAETSDLFTPVEEVLNAAATMLVATLRTQIATFRNADPDLFSGLDQASGQALVDVHLPNLLKAYRTAHDASQGEERDEVRAEFSRTLRGVRESIDQIMVRHAREARAVLETESRFLASRDTGAWGTD